MHHCLDMVSAPLSVRGAELLALMLQLFEGTQSVGPVAGVRQHQGQYQPPSGAGECLEGAQLDPNERRPRTGQLPHPLFFFHPGPLWGGAHHFVCSSVSISHLHLSRSSSPTLGCSPLQDLS